MARKRPVRGGNTGSERGGTRASIPQRRAPEHGSSIPGRGAGGSAPRREAVGPSAPSPRQRTCTHEQRVPDPTGDGHFRSVCATAKAHVTGEWSDAWRMPSPASIAKRARSVLGQSNDHGP